MTRDDKKLLCFGMTIFILCCLWFVSSK